MIDKILGAILGFGAASMFSKKKTTSDSPKKRSSGSSRRRSSSKKMMPQTPKSPRFNYDRYISPRNIESVEKRSGASIDGSRVLSGAYVSDSVISKRLSSQYAKGGTLEGATYIPIGELKSVMTKDLEVISVENLYSGVWYE